MNLETEYEINKTMDDFIRVIIRAFTKAAYRIHVEADIEAVAVTGDPMDWAVIDTEALAYAQDYQKMLIEEGSTIVNGVKYNWLEKFDAAARAEIGQIITEGIEQGLYAGDIETKKGTYPKGSTAARLKKFFHERKSHAAMVARTETQHIRSTAKLNRWKKDGYGLVYVRDGDGGGPCDICKDKNGQVWTIDYAMTHVNEHPNCVRRFTPVKELTHLGGPARYINVDGSMLEHVLLGPAIGSAPG